MSRHSNSSKHRSHHSRATNGNDEDLVDQVKIIINLLYEVVPARSHEWENYLESARSAMTALDRLHFFRDPHRFEEQVWILHGLQDYAFHDADTGCIQDIAEWCQTAWLRILRNSPENVATLSGLGRNWLQRSQATLARIHREEGNDSSSQGSGPNSSLFATIIFAPGSSADAYVASPPADPRRQGPLYVEARGYLQPAVDFYNRAVRSADSTGSITGEILAVAAESQMSLGNVTGAPNDERHFTQAIRLLRRAEAMPGYTLSIYLQQYLNDFGRYVN